MSSRDATYLNVLSGGLDTMLKLLLEDLERLQFQLEMEAALRESDRAVANRLGQLAIEAEDAANRVRALTVEKALAVPGELIGMG